MTAKSTERFGDRVENYIKYRPTYPAQVLDVMKKEMALTPDQVIADVGSGTGISAKLFLQNGCRVFGVEPNDKMRGAAETYLKDFPGFTSCKGGADATGLAEHSVDFVVAAQAFHWFEPVAAKKEFSRILKPGGWIVLMWNDRDIETTAFDREYEELIHRYSIDYKEINHKNVDEKRIGEFLGNFKLVNVPNFQDVDFAGLLGRLVSSSYIPNEDSPRFPAMKADLQALFDKHQKQNQVRITYTTQIFFNHL